MMYNIVYIKKTTYIMRTMNDYNKDFQAALEFQDFVMEEMCKLGFPMLMYSSLKKQLAGENTNGIEIKYDRKFRETGNFYITVAAKATSDSNWHPCGITKQDNSWLYLIGDYDDFYIFSKQQLFNIFVTGEIKTIINNEGTNRGFLLPVDYKNGFYIINHIKCSTSKP